MEFFNRAKSVRLKSYHSKYLIADKDKESVFQDRCGTTKTAKWTVEIVNDTSNLIRLKSFQGKYLTASKEQRLLGVTGRKVIQSVPRKLDSSVEWEPVREGKLVRLKTRNGNFLRANAGIPSWRNSITHGIPSRHSSWVLWDVDVIEIIPESPKRVSHLEFDDFDLTSAKFSLRSPELSAAVAQLKARQSSFDGSRSGSDGRLIFYTIPDSKGRVLEGKSIERSFHFKGLNLDGLIQKLEEETDLVNITVCQRNSVNGKLCPLRLALPPNNAAMHVVVVPPEKDE